LESKLKKKKSSDGNNKVDTLLLRKEGFPISPVPPPAPPAPPKPVIIINGKVIFPSEDNSIDPSTLKTIDIRGIEPDKKQATSKMVWTESTDTNAEGGRQVITITVDSTKNKSESSGLTGKVSKVIIKTNDDPIVAMAEKDPTTISINSTDEKGKKVYTIVRTEKNLTELPKDVLYIIDGKEISQKEMKDLSPTLIQSISIIKGESAIALFGERGKNGVVEIKTKK
jgi:TonB-dependent SusC/RagA subfamily outer membrane receptor